MRSSPLDLLPPEILASVLSLVDQASLHNARASSRVLKECVDKNVVQRLHVKHSGGWQGFQAHGWISTKAELVGLLRTASTRWPGLRSLTISGMIGGGPGSWLGTACKPAQGCLPLFQQLTSLTMFDMMLPLLTAKRLAAGMSLSSDHLCCNLYPDS
jgi:hypothetical protein